MILRNRRTRKFVPGGKLLTTAVRNALAEGLMATRKRINKELAPMPSFPFLNKVDVRPSYYKDLDIISPNPTFNDWVARNGMDITEVKKDAELYNKLADKFIKSEGISARGVEVPQGTALNPNVRGDAGDIIGTNNTGIYTTNSLLDLAEPYTHGNGKVMILEDNIADHLADITDTNARLRRMEEIAMGNSPFYKVRNFSDNAFERAYNPEMTTLRVKSEIPVTSTRPDLQKLDGEGRWEDDFWGDNRRRVTRGLFNSPTGNRSVLPQPEESRYFLRSTRPTDWYRRNMGYIAALRDLEKQVASKSVPSPPSSLHDIADLAALKKKFMEMGM